MNSLRPHDDKLIASCALFVMAFFPVVQTVIGWVL